MKRIAVALVFVCAGVASAQVVTYEVSFQDPVYPEDVGWVRTAYLDCERSLENGSLVQVCDAQGEQDLYRRSLGAFADVDGFFVEWRVKSSVSSELFDEWGIATCLSAYGYGNAIYHFTMTDELVRLFLSVDDWVFVEIAPGVLHTYRLELYVQDSQEWYAWYVDGELADVGLTYGDYPRSDSEILWDATYDVFENNTTWDFVRYGVIPEDGRGDYDSDGDVDERDYYFFTEYFDAVPDVDAGPGGRFADSDGDTDVDCDDWFEFAARWTDIGQARPPARPEDCPGSVSSDSSKTDDDEFIPKSTVRPPSGPPVPGQRRPPPPPLDPE